MAIHNCIKYFQIVSLVFSLVVSKNNIENIHVYQGNAIEIIEYFQHHVIATEHESTEHQ